VKSRFAALAALATLFVNGAAMAVEPRNWQLGLQPAHSPTATSIHHFHNGLLIVITVITVFVLILLLYASWRFREKRNPTPSTTTHNTLIEILWTVIPIMILIGIAIPSFRLLYFADRTTDADMTLKILGNQWYWSYEYPDNGNFTFDANLVQDADLKPGQHRLMTTDNPVVLPVGKKIRLLMTSRDVLHSWAVSSLGVKLDNVPGRTNETWVEIDTPGTYYGFCSELCGAGHAYMPIMVKAVTPAEFDNWVELAKKTFAQVDAPAAPAKVKQAATPESRQVAQDSARN
jgi:cytochrome c oxidase subunit 2